MQSTRLRKDHIHAISAGFLSLHCKHAMHGPGCWQLSDLTLPAMTETPAPPRVSTAPPSWKLWEFALAADPSQCSPAKTQLVRFHEQSAVKICKDLSGSLRYVWPSWVYRNLLIASRNPSWLVAYAASCTPAGSRRPQNAGGTQYAYVCLKV